MLERLLQRGFDPTAPAFFAWEGVSMYLPRSLVHATLARIQGMSCAGSTLAFDLYAGDHHGAPRLERAAMVALRLLGEPVVFGVDPADAPDLIREAGLEPLEVVSVRLLCQRWGYADGHRSLSLVHARVTE